jgi:hypothetical protein
MNEEWYEEVVELEVDQPRSASPSPRHSPSLELDIQYNHHALVQHVGMTWTALVQLTRLNPTCYLPKFLPWVQQKLFELIDSKYDVDSRFRVLPLMFRKQIHLLFVTLEYLMHDLISLSPLQSEWIPILTSVLYFPMVFDLGKDDQNLIDHTLQCLSRLLTLFEGISWLT